MLPTPKPHDIETISLGYARCLCKWEYRVETYRGKTDEDLALEVGLAHEKHKAAWSNR